MNPLKHKMANEWMRQEDATPEEALDTWNTMEAEFKANRAMSQEPRTLVADASTEMEQFPDSFLRPKRYDILTGLDVPAETLEDWDTSFRNPNAEGGVQQLVQNTADGSRPGYSGKSAKKEILNLPKDSTIDLQKLANKHNVTVGSITHHRDKNRPDLKSVQVRYKKKLKYSQGVVEPNITLSKAGTYEVATKGKHLGTFADIDDARDALSDFKTDNPDLYTKKPKKTKYVKLPTGAANTLYKDEDLSQKIIKFANEGKQNDFILNKIGNPKGISEKEIREVINQYASEGDIDEKYKRTRGGKIQFEVDARNKIIEDMIKKDPLPTAVDIGKKAKVTVSTVTDHMREIKGDDWVDTNYGEGRHIRRGDTPLKKQFLEYVNNNPAENFTMKNILKKTDIKTKTEANKIFKAMMHDVYHKRAPEIKRPVLYIDEKINLKDLTAKLRSSEDFTDQFARSMDRLLLEAYDGKLNSKGYRTARQTLSAYRKLIQPLNKKYPSLAQVIEHPIPYTFLTEVKAGKDPLSLINTYILGESENKFKSFLDQRKIKIRRGLVDDPKNKKLLTQLEDMGKLENLLSKETGMKFGKIKAKFTDPNVQNIDFGAKTFGKEKVVPQIKESFKIRERVVDFYNKFKNDKTVQEVFKKAGIGPKIFGMLGRLRKGNIKGFLKQMDEILKENPGLRVKFEDEFKDIENQYAALDTGTMTDAGMKIDFSMPHQVKEAGLPSEVVAAGTLPVMKYGKKLMSGVGKGIAGIDLPVLQVAGTLATGDPTYLAYSAPFTEQSSRWTNLAKPAKTKAGQWVKNILSGIGPKRLASLAPAISRYGSMIGIPIMAKDYYGAMINMVSSKDPIADFNAPILESRGVSKENIENFQNLKSQTMSNVIDRYLFDYYTKGKGVEGWPDAPESKFRKHGRYADGGLTRTVAPDSEGILSLKKKW